MVMRGRSPNLAGIRQQWITRVVIAENDADRLWQVVVALRGQAVAEASPVGVAHLAAVDSRGKDETA